MGESNCLECKLTPICKMYETANHLIDQGEENSTNKINEDNLFKLVAYDCEYYEGK